MDPNCSKVDGEMFLRADYRDEEFRLIFYYTDDMLDIAIEHTKYNADATFDIVPKDFKESQGSQLFTLLAYSPRAHKSYPIVHVLMSSKSEKAYEAMFSILKLKFIRFDISHITIDFEDALINAIKKQFPDAIIYGCYFHYVKQVKENYQNKKCDDPLLLHVIIKLPYIEPMARRFYMETLLNKFTDNDNRKKFISYWIREWGGKDKAKMLTLSSRRDFDGNTNNISESFNSLIQPNKRQIMSQNSMMKKLYEIDNAKILDYKNTRKGEPTYSKKLVHRYFSAFNR